MAIGRREWIGLIGGAAVGTAFSPVPWKLLDDSAIWTQNWSWTPTPARGPVEEKYALCTLCSAGCGLKARCVSGGGIFSVAPAVPAASAAHPAVGGALCAAVYGAHQLPYHPRRLKAAVVDGNPTDTQQAIAEAGRRIEAAGTAFAILDERPGRVLSSLYGLLTRTRGGSLLTLAQPEDRTLRTIEELAGVPHGSLGYDFEHAALILSIGAPLLDAWGSTPRMTRLWSSRTTSSPQFIHAGSVWSRTAQLADRTLILRPGSEAALVAALAGKLTAGAAAAITGLTPSVISDLTQRLRDHTPAIVVGGGEAASGGLPESTERMIAALNISLGSLGRAGGIVARRPLPGTQEPPRYLDRIPDGSLAVLLHDASTAGIVVAESLLRRKLAPNGSLVRLTAFRPDRHDPRDILIPSTSFLESDDESCGARDASVSSWRYAAALSPAPAYAMAPQTFAATLAEALQIETGTYEAQRDARAAAIASTKRGSLYNQATGEQIAAPDGDAFHTAISEGAVWIDEPAPHRPLQANLDSVDWSVRTSGQPELVAVASANRGALSALPAVPLASKLDRETRLYAVPGEVRMNPRTARALDLKPGDSISVATSFGQTRGRVRCDVAAIPGQLELAACGDQGQVVLDAMGASETGAGDTQPARIRRS